MNFLRGIIQGVKAWTGKPMATPETDPAGIIGILNAMPNPDPILRHLGEAETVYASIMADAHVMGEVRSVRGSFRSHQWRIVAGQEDDARSQAAAELCTTWLQKTSPNNVADWLEVMWQMSSAIFTGYRVQEIVQQAQSQKIACIALGVADAATMTALFTSGVEYMQGDFIAPATERMTPAY